MSGMLKKRSHEDEALLFSLKRFHGETEQQILRIFEEIEYVDKIQEEAAVSRVMTSLGKEIGVSSCSTSYQGFSEISRDGYLASDMTSAYGATDGVIDLDYLLAASDDELGIPLSPVANLKGQAKATSSLNDKSCDPFLDFDESAEIKGLAENWHIEDDFLDYSQLAVFEDTVSADWDVVNLGAFIDGDYSASSPWGLEPACAT
ncbi:hypothetical protein KI387_027602, partial [Taxus chinensis]